MKAITNTTLKKLANTKRKKVMFLLSNPEGRIII